MKQAKIFFILLILLNWRPVNAQLISTFAGSGSAGHGGDGGPATAAGLYLPYSTTSDGAGNVYIADFENNRVRKVDVYGTITTYAGNGNFDHSGDGGPANEAGILAPAAVLADSLGNLYIAESASSSQDGGCIRKVNTSGNISTIAGTGLAGFSGDGGPATAAAFRTITGVAIDGAGNVYIVDEGNNRVRKVNSDGIISTIAGIGTAGYSGDGGPAVAAKLNSPYSITLDNAGNIYFSDLDNNVIRKINTDGIIATIAGNGQWGYVGNAFHGDGGPATLAELFVPFGVAVDREGNVYIADGWNNAVRKVDPSGIITTIAGNSHEGFSGDGGPATAAELWTPICISIDYLGNMYICDDNNLRVRIIPSPTRSREIKNSGTANDTRELNVWPNPNNGSFTLTASGPANETTHIITTNAIGQKVNELNIPNNIQTEFNLNVPPGVYFINASTSQGKQVVKIFVK